MLDHFDSHQHEDSEQANSSTTAPSQFAQGKKESDKVNKICLENLKASFGGLFRTNLWELNLIFQDLILELVLDFY